MINADLTLAQSMPLILKLGTPLPYSNKLLPFENRKVLIRIGQLSGREGFKHKEIDDTTPPPQMPITIHLQPITCDPKPYDTVR